MSGAERSPPVARAQGAPCRPLVCWACEELMAVRSATGRFVLEADAELAEVAGQPAIVCRCGAVTVIACAAD